MWDRADNDLCECQAGQERVRQLAQHGGAERNWLRRAGGDQSGYDQALDRQHFAMSKLPTNCQTAIQ
jgi:hypothetical protein